MGLSKGGAVTAVIDRLEKAGFARRRRDASDRRHVIVELDREGAYTGFRQIFERFSEAYTALIEKYDDARLALLLDFANGASEIVYSETMKIRNP
ncbi:MarR family transcriptional regulator [Sphaerisporangium dianthi]|uniref:MarR family transcriptional regulator n=1 Tax=Sphaerisporangium dianthi TaxID=1436120 RepID=A0ABV9CD30_9ACTN